MKRLFAFLAFSALAFAQSNGWQVWFSNPAGQACNAGQAALYAAAVSTTWTCQNGVFVQTSGGGGASIAPFTTDGTNVTLPSGTFSVGQSTPTGSAAKSIATLGHAYGPTYDIAAWGDSLTAGGYPATLTALSGWTVYNGGVGGQGCSGISTRMLADTTMRNAFVVIWAGSNDIPNTSGVPACIASMVAAIAPSTRYLVVSPLTNIGNPSGSSNYNSLIALNNTLAAAYPNNWLDIRSLLVGQYNTASPLDVIDHTNDMTPSSLRNGAGGFGLLSSAIGDASTCSFTLNWTNGSATANQIITVDGELIQISTISGTAPGTITVSGCTRGYASTAAASHLNGATFSAYDMIHLNADGYNYVASQIATWIAAHDTGIGQAFVSQSGVSSMLSRPPNTGAFTTLSVKNNSGATLTSGGAALQIIDTAPPATGVGGEINFQGAYSGTPSWNRLTSAATIKASKVNSTDGDYNFNLKIAVRDGVAANPVTVLTVSKTALIGPVYYSSAGLQDGSTAAKSACVSNNRGLIYVEKGATNVADQPFVCVKNSSNAYVWVQLSVVP